nr:immunoglobulin heavy chain junction region [Mus musculus]MBK4196607.1 immunoglobulin heavy chain junction region [Mus musculus]
CARGGLLRNYFDYW